jgi:type II secretory pathway pseudopilin PulG
MTLIELLIVIAILAGFALLASPIAGKFIRRSQGLAAYSSVQQVLATARLQAVKRGANVVVLADLVNVSPKVDPDAQPSWRLRFTTFQDRANDEESPLPADEASAAANFVQDTTFAKPNTGEPTLGEVFLPANMVLWKHGGTRNDTGAALAFDEYAGDAALTNRIAFLPTGGIAPPENTTTSGLPTTTGGRGIYFADHHGKNFFRVTIDSDLSGRIRVDKYRDGTGYQSQTHTSPWAWY